jgi:hypothetical protein
MHELKCARSRPGSSGGSRVRRAMGLIPFAAVMALGPLIAACDESFDAGSLSHGDLPVDQRNPIVLLNDSVYDNWQGEYALLLANNGGPKLEGIVVGTGGIWSDSGTNMGGWMALLKAAKSSNMNIPELIPSGDPPLKRPTNGEIDSTVPNDSYAANFICQTADRVSLPYRPLVLVTGGRLTDVADAYRVCPRVKDLVVVVSSLGKSSSQGATMDDPNGEMDPWADSIVTAKFRYIQVSAYYDQTADVPDSRLEELPPNNTFATWIKTKQPKISGLDRASDQVAVAAVGIPEFVVHVKHVSAGGPVAADAKVGPVLTEAPNGPLWLVDQSAGSLAAGRFWKLLHDPKTFKH